MGRLQRRLQRRLHKLFKIVHKILSTARQDVQAGYVTCKTYIQIKTVVKLKINTH